MPYLDQQIPSEPQQTSVPNEQATQKKPYHRKKVFFALAFMILIVVISLVIYRTFIMSKAYEDSELNVLEAKPSTSAATESANELNQGKVPVGILYYESFPDPDNINYEKGLDLYSISSNGEKKKYSRPNNCGIYDIVSRAALCTTRDGPNLTEVYFLNLVNNKSKLIDFKNIDKVKVNNTLRLSNNGETLLIAETGFRPENYVIPKLFRINIETGSQKVIFKGKDTEHIINYPTSSNDGNYIAFFYTTLNQYRFFGETSVVVVNKDGKKIAEFKKLNNSFADRSLKISDNNEKVFYYVRGGKEGITYYLMDIKTGKVKTTTLKETHWNDTSACGELFDGEDSVYFVNDYNVTKLNLETNKRSNIIKLNEAIECLYLNAKYATTRPLNPEDNHYNTFIIDLKTGKRSEFLKQSEFVKAWFEN